MVSNGDIITGKFNIFINGKYKHCMQNKSKESFIALNDISSYNVELFEYNKNIDTVSIDMLEKLSDCKDNILINNISYTTLADLIREHNLLIINQELLLDIIFKDSFPSNYQIIANSKFCIGNLSIKTYITDKDLNAAYFINVDSNNNIINYKKIIP